MVGSFGVGVGVVVDVDVDVYLTELLLGEGMLWKVVVWVGQKYRDTEK